MLPLSKIDDQLTVFHKNRVVLFGASSAGKKVLKQLQEEKIDVYCFCDNDREKWGKTVEGIKVVPPSELPHMEGVVVQIASDFDADITAQLKDLKIKNFITFQCYNSRLYALKFYRLKKNYVQLYQDYIHSKETYEGLSGYEQCWKYFLDVLEKHKNMLILALPPKTGDWTISATLEAQSISYINFWHTLRHLTPELKNVLKGRKIKIISAVREPVSQNLSEAFQIFDYMWDWDDAWVNGGSYQKLFEEFLHMEFELNILQDNNVQDTYMRNRKQQLYRTLAIQNFFEQQFSPTLGADIYQYPFDQEKGYSIYHINNMEIFIYQLEKLNSLKKELADFIGVEDFELINDNEGKNKWYAMAYEDAKKNIKLSRDYVEGCYRGKFANHFYSHEDIQKFKKKWEQRVIK